MELIDLVNCVIILNDLIQMVNFPTQIPTISFMDLFLFSDATICSTMALAPLGNSDHVVV